MEDSSIETVPINDEEPTPLIVVRNAYKRYTKTAIVLQGLNMSVNRGSIYGLLGPSGCGKTTLLSCLVGRQVLDSGTIIVGLDSKLQLGYMPQDVSLYEGLFVSELFMYFGLLMKKDEQTILAKGKELIEFLELPPSSRIISTLSGGQQRRVSMAVALLHNPQLLILDEPTVGVDPLLSHKIWIYFLKLTNEDKKTIIITTHYIEEAKNSHTIGLMRSGVILAEMCPTGLMRSLNCSTLEEAFLLLSQKQETHEIEPSEYPKSNLSTSDLPFRTGVVFANYRFKAQLYKNYCWTKRNISMTAFMILLPAVLFWIFMGMLGGKLELVKLATVMDELTPGEDDCFNPTTIGNETVCSTNVRISCDIISYLRNISYQVIEYKTLNDGIHAVKYNKTVALLYFPKNYSEALLERIIKGYKAKNKTLETSFMDAYFDNTDFVVSTNLRKKLLTAFYESVGSILTRCGINKRIINIPPIKNNPPIFDSPDMRYQPMSGYVISILAYLAYVYTSTAMAYDKLTGVGERAAVSGITRFEVAVAHICIQTIMAVIQCVTIFFIIYEVFHFKSNGQFFSIATLCLLSEYCGMAIGFIVSEISNEERFLSYFGVAFIITLFFSVGMIWPTQGMHWILKLLNEHNPMRKATVTYESLRFRSLPFTNGMIYEGYFHLVVFFFILCLIFFFRIRNS